MSWQLYLALSAVMFMEYAIWGAWLPVLAARLLGPLRFTGKQTGWIYATLPLACIIFPLIAGQLADRWINTELILAVSHLTGSVFLFIAARRTTFRGVFASMLLYSIFYAATLPLVNSMMFHHLGKAYSDESAVDAAAGKIFLWAPIAWAIAGYFLTAWRWRFKTGEQGRDCLYLAAVLSIIMGIMCIFMPQTPPTPVGEQAAMQPIIKTFEMLGNFNFSLFIIISVVISSLMQFYFQGTARFMQDVGIESKNIPAAMGIAQAVQAVVTLLALGLLLNNLGFKWTLVAGVLSWLLLYSVYVGTRDWRLIIPAQAFHGVAYVLFIIGGQIYTKSAGPKEFISTMQALIFAATTGLGLLIGTRFAGITMDRFRKQDQFQWRSIFLVPCVVIIACLSALVLFFRG